MLWGMEFNDAMGKKSLHLANALRSSHHSKLAVRVKSLSFLGNCRDEHPSHPSPNPWLLSDPTAPTSYPACTIFLSSIGNRTSYGRKAVGRAGGPSVPVLGNYIFFSQKSRWAPSI